MTPQESRTARALLGWTQQDLANFANVALSTVADFENGLRNPREPNMTAMATAFYKAGVIFEIGDFVGVKMKRK